METSLTSTWTAICLTCAVASGCEGDKVGAASKASAPTTVTGAVSPTSAPSPGGQVNLGISSAYEQMLGCSGPNAGKHPNACRIAKEFASAELLADLPTSGVDLYFGQTYEVTAAEGSESTKFFFVRIKKDGGKLLGDARDLKPENAAEKKDATELLREVQAGRTPPKSEALTFMRTLSPTMDAMTQSEGSHIIKKPEPYAHVRARSGRLYVVEKSGTGGWFSELWKVPAR